MDRILILDGLKKRQKSYCYVSDTGELNIWDHEIDFTNYPIKICTSPIDKAYYAIASFCGVAINHDKGYFRINNDEEMLKEIMETLKEIEPKIQSLRYSNHVSLRCKDIIISIQKFMGAINWSSYQLLPIFMREYNIDIETFIKSPKYAVVIEDEEGLYDRFSEYGLIQTDIIKTDFNISDYEKIAEQRRKERLNQMKH